MWGPKENRHMPHTHEFSFLYNINSFLQRSRIPPSPNKVACAFHRAESYSNVNLQAENKEMRSGKGVHAAPPSKINFSAKIGQ